MGCRWPSVTELDVLTTKRIDTILPMLVVGEAVETEPVAKLLGPMIGSKLYFGEHIGRRAVKAENGLPPLIGSWQRSVGPSPMSAKC